MTEKEKKFLSDITSSIELIESFTIGINTFEQYSTDLKTKGAVERHLGIIGEAVSKFMKESETNDLKKATQIISLRNRLIDSFIRQRAERPLRNTYVAFSALHSHCALCG